VGLAQRIYSSEGPMLLVPRWFDDVAAADAWRRQNPTDAARQERAAKIDTRVRAQVQLGLEESIVPPAPSDTPIGVVQRVFFSPDPGKVGQMRSLLEAFVRTEQAAGWGQVQPLTGHL